MVQISRLADESVGARERLLAAYEEIYGPDDTRTNTRRIGLAQTLVGAGDYDGAVTQFRRIRDVAARKGLPETHVAALRIDAGIANALRRKGDHDGALREAGRVVLLLDAAHGGCDQNEQLARLVRGAVRMLEGDAAGALADARCAVDLLDRCPDTLEPSRIIATSFLADAMCNAGLEDEGRSLIRDLRSRVTPTTATKGRRSLPRISGGGSTATRCARARSGLPAVPAAWRCATRSRRRWRSCCPSGWRRRPCWRCSARARRAASSWRRSGGPWR
jgi:hypothetical protein